MGMAKREIRAVEASSDVAAIIDKGADIDTQITNLGFEDKGLRKKVENLAKEQMGDGDLSLRLLGKTSAALVSGVEKVELNMSAEQFPDVQAAISKGLLAGLVDRNLTLVVPPADVERAAAELAKAGIRANVVESMKVSGDKLREEMAPGKIASREYTEALHSLNACVKRDVTFRVKYERI
jgi:hypothetical protein